MKRIERRAHINAILEEFRGLKNITRIKTRQKRKHIPQMTNKDGTKTSDRQTIADVFADFYADIYKARTKTSTTNDE
eukprot:3790014-Karenia_brevis.AAC.1